MEKGSCFQGVNKSSTAYKLLSKMGWQEGQGLGAQKQGITTHVKVRKKADASGVGAVQEAAKARDWTLGMAAYDRVLASLKVVASSTDAKTPKKAKKRQSAAEEEEEVTTKSRKKPRGVPSSASQELEIQRQGVASESLEAAEQTAVEESSDLKERRKLATHVGRFKKVVRGKCVKGYSSHDLAAILGGSGSRQPAEHINRLPDASSTCMLAAEPIPSEEAGKQDGCPGATGSEETSWWSGRFVKAGRAGSASDRSECTAAKPSVHISNFTEGDQANLWQSATDGQSKSRQGLGQAEAPKKVGGVRWAGTKTRIGDSDDEGEEEANASGDEERPEVAVVEGIVIVPPKRRATEAAGAEVEANPCNSDEPSLTAPEPEKPIKWRKIAKRILGTAEGNKMRLKAFKSQAWEAAAKSGAIQKKACMQSMLEVLSGSSHFNVGKKEISLRPA